jgi:hypothetical protein
MTDHGWEDWPEEQPDLPDGDTGDLDGYGDGEFGAGAPDLEPPEATDLGDGPDLGEAPADEPAPLGYDETLADEPSADATAGEPAGTAGFGPADDAPVGADPDLDPHGEDPDWSPFPEALELGAPPEPVDGFPWTDPAVLGEAATALPDPAVEATAGTPEPADLYAYAGEDAPAGVGWAALAGSPDPATSALARFWAPGA